MNKKECRAKNPNVCRYHGREAYKRATGNLEAWEKSLASSENFERTEEVKQYIARYSLMRDATETGFKKLDKEYRKTIVRGTDEEKANVSTRLRQATELRQMDDGVDGYAVWAERTSVPEKLASYAIEQGESSSVVKIPISQTGTQAMIGTASFLEKSGYKVTDLEAKPVNNARSSLLSKETIKEALLNNLETHSPDRMTGFALDNGFYVEGLTFLNSKGEEVKLTGSWALTRELDHGKVDDILNIPKRTDEEWAARRG